MEKVVLITGSSKGIGKATAIEFAKIGGYKVVINYLTDRENAVLSHFAKNEGEIVYAKDLAAILNLPRDYVYKYIKNLRTKIDEDILENAVKGGYIFHLPASNN